MKALHRIETTVVFDPRDEHIRQTLLDGRAPYADRLLGYITDRLRDFRFREGEPYRFYSGARPD